MPRSAITLIALAAAVASSPGRAQNGLVREQLGPTPAPTVGFSPATSEPPPQRTGPDKDPVSGVELRGMMWRLAQTMKGHPVLAVGYGQYRPDVEWSDEAFQQAQSVIEKLQIISAKQSSPEQELIPFRVQNAYVIAPQMREGLNLQLGGLPPLQVAARGTLLADVLLRLPEAQVKALGSGQGLAVSSLPPEFQAALAQAFRPPLNIIEMVPDTSTDENGMPQRVFRHEEKGTLTEPVNWKNARIRARLRSNGVHVMAENYGTIIGHDFGTGLSFTEAAENHVPWRNNGTDLPLFDPVPNTFKPSDLEGKRFTQPFGLEGVWLVKDVLKRLEQATGLKLRAWPEYEDQPVFLGNTALATGEVLDGLRLALTATWRKMGDTYLLAWDRLPLQAIQLLARESAQATTKNLQKRVQEMQSEPGWLTLVRNIPFADDDPLSPSPDQQERMFTPRDGDRDPNKHVIPFTELRPDQQAYIRARAREESMWIPPDQPGEASSRRPITEEDIMRSSLQPGGKVEVSIQLPGYGWVRSSNSWENLDFHSYMLQRAWEKAHPEARSRDILEGAPPEVKAWLEDPKPISLQSDMRAMMVPPLGTARLNELADEMHRHGLNTLFFPVLHGGYATIPSKAFPLDPALRGADGWAAAQAAMKPKGIRVVGTISVLAWQHEEDRSHWLNKYPQWMDVDAAGRTRLQWLNANPEGMKAMGPFGSAPANFVRASEPAVQAKLTTLLAEFAARKDAAGVAFASWQTPFPLPFGMGPNTVIPELGYALADRLTAFRKTGEDPADRVTYEDYVPATLRDRIWRARPDEVTEIPHAMLLDSLIKQARTHRADWKVYTLEDTPMLRRGPEGSSGANRPKPDLNFSTLFMSGPGEALQNGLLLPITKRNFFDTMQDAIGEEIPENIPTKLRELPSVALFGLMLRFDSPVMGKSLKAVVYDFRTAPDMITPSLRWILPPGAEPEPAQATPPPQTAGTSAGSQAPAAAAR